MSNVLLHTVDEELPDPCSYNPCGDDGTCVVTGLISYKCVCSDGTIGDACQGIL